MRQTAPGQFGVILVLLALLTRPVPADDQKIPAFPGAEGFGANTPGGRGGKVLIVTTLEDYQPGGQEKPIRGSLRAAVETDGPRIVVFRVSGIIELKAPLQITKPFITLAGQTAPGGGVCWKDEACVVRTHDVVIRHLRFRPGDELAAKHHARGKSKQIDALSVAVGGWPIYAAGSPPADSDKDGMPDAWETKHQLDPTRATDARDDSDGDHYTNIEEYLNGTDP